ncbi:hypothetical protein ABZ626_03790 [Streptomyces longispororuber]|uniref:hypothetical protein n=1 Tax=Streptomyces longispororuber TaxID=68230 RepID=UPI0033FBC6FA
MARLTAAVHIQHPTTMEWIVLAPGDEPEPVLAAEITNPHAWEGDEAAVSEADRPPEPPPFGFTGSDAAPEPEPEPTTKRRTKTARAND